MQAGLSLHPNDMFSQESHNDNKPMQYIAILYGCKNDNFQMKNCDIFLIFVQNKDRGGSN